MLTLDGRLNELRRSAAELAPELRAQALALDADPAQISHLLDLPAYDLLRKTLTPRHLRSGTPRSGLLDFDHSCLAVVVSLLELARGDAGLVLACPGPALAGMVIDQLADEAQQVRFYDAMADGRTWSFFAMTEPAHGNDATGMQTALVKDPNFGYRLNGVKRYIGNGARARFGVVFARTGPGPLAIRAALIELDNKGTTQGTRGTGGFSARPLDMVGLRGARVAELVFDGLPVSEEALLGRHLSGSRRGIWGAMRTFNRMRSVVAALAVGTGLAIHELVVGERPAAPGAVEVAMRLESCRQLVYAAAATADRDPDNAQASSAAKMLAQSVAVRTSRWAASALGPAAALEYPLLEKWMRDVRAFEFMEGTTNIQRAHVARAYLRKDRER
ncbi:alkylation response protein AidB-like acyl-CoA dehydrogenase [Catenulispora sp. GP43]|uniref:acyl-CoA dehydrogenase family protein n=1 Tax=Catenulispora sp. GP43 TaxID=3156263 RepID=UPI0035153632